MKRGDVYLADLEPIRGAEANKARPVVLVGNNAALGAAARFSRGVVTVVPCTSNVAIRGGMHVAIRPSPLNGLRVLSKAQAEQIRSIDLSRLQQRLGKLTTSDVRALDGAIRFHLAL
jgi:mRNA interferase MazF